MLQPLESTLSYLDCIKNVIRTQLDRYYLWEYCEVNLKHYQTVLGIKVQQIEEILTKIKKLLVLAMKEMPSNKRKILEQQQPSHFREIQSVSRKEQRTIQFSYLAKEESFNFLSRNLSKKTIVAINQEIESLKKLVEGNHWLKNWFVFDHESFFSLRFLINQHLAAHRIFNKLVMSLHGYWIFFLDDTRNTFVFPMAKESKSLPICFGRGISYGDKFEKFLRETMLPRQVVYPGQGAMGLGIRADRGVCIANTIRDLRTSASVEDYAMRNLSYVGVPIFTSPKVKSDKEMPGSSGRALAHFGLFFPAVNAWEYDHSFNYKRNIYRLIANFCEEVHPLIIQVYKSFWDVNYLNKVQEVSALGTKSDYLSLQNPENRRLEFLKALLPDEKIAGKTHMTDLLGIRAAQIWTKSIALASTSHWQRVSKWLATVSLLRELKKMGKGLFKISDSENLSSGNNYRVPYTNLEDYFFECQGYLTNEKNGQHSLNIFSLLTESIGQIFLKRFTLRADALEASAEIWIAYKSDPHSLLENPANDFEQLLCKYWSKWPKSELMSILFPEYKIFENGDIYLQRILSNKCIDMIHNSASSHLVQLLTQRTELKTAFPQTRIISAAVQIQLLPDAFEDVKLAAENIERFLATGDIDVCMSMVYVFSGKWRIKLVQFGDAWQSSKFIKDKITRELLFYYTNNVLYQMIVLFDECISSSHNGMVFITSDYFEEGPRQDIPLQDKYEKLQPEKILGNTQAKRSYSNWYFLKDLSACTAIGIEEIWNIWWQEAAKSSSVGDCRLIKYPIDSFVIGYQSSSDRNHILMYPCHHSDLAHILDGNKFPSQICILWERGKNNPSFFPIMMDASLSSPILEKIRDKIQSQNDILDHKSWHAFLDVTAQQGEPSPQETIAKYLRKCLIQERNGRAGEICVPVVCKIDPNWIMLSAREQQKNCWCCNPKAKKEFIDSVVAFIEGKKAPYGFDSKFGLRVHTIFPISSPHERDKRDIKKEILGFAIFSGSQIEFDVASRLKLLPEQLNLLNFAIDYLEFALGQELARTHLEGTLASFAHAHRKRLGWFNFAKLSASSLEKLQYRLDAKDIGDIMLKLPAAFQQPGYKKTIGLLLLNILYGQKKLTESGIIEDGIETLILLDAMCRTLAGKPEWPADILQENLHIKAGIPQNWQNLKKCILTVATKEHKKVSKQFSSKSILETDIDAAAELVTVFPAGTVAVIVEELIKNAVKYASQNSTIEIKLKMFHNNGQAIISCKNSIGRSEHVNSFSTGHGLDNLNRCCVVNFGTRIVRPKNNAEIWKIEIAMDLDYYRKSIEKSGYYRNFIL